ncbi:S41 family peptidase [Pedobacter frigiditerrae]|uniref:S41 family peptidase n=1 Tax=Pedobacter frigiditerrae TaxID=2530452 RepID=UPI00292E43FC|nr:S41 family peptidase [Pedobacter frigiditerrae]
MKNIIALISFLLLTNSMFAQKSYEAKIGYTRLKSDLDFFCSIRKKANSGLYKYRTVAQIDSAEKAAYKNLSDQTTLREFFNIINELADFEGSVHNDVAFSAKIANEIITDSVYFPIPIKVIDGKIRVNSNNGKIPLGAEILSINGINSTEILKRNSIYYTTDGFSIDAKTFAQDGVFSSSLFYSNGKKDSFKVNFKINGDNIVRVVILTPVTRNVFAIISQKKHSITLDSIYKSLTQMPYNFEIVNKSTAKLNIRSFEIGENAKDPKHLQFVNFLDSCFIAIKKNADMKNLIVDVRNNRGGTDPNDMVAFSYLANKPFRENISAFSNFIKIPSWKNVDYKAFFLKRILAKWIYQKKLKKAFPVAKNGVFYQGNDDNKLRYPNENAFKGQIYLLINPKVASAASMFAAMVAGNTNAIIVGQESGGGYYGHNGHIPMGYILPNSKIKYQFSIVNINQDVPVKKNQPFGRGIIPDYKVEQTLTDFLNHKDTQMDFLLKLIDDKNRTN